jgi:type IV pilus assembly protein PilA
MKKGFTLIELLAVIIILAVIALIATPKVMDIIKDVQNKVYYLDETQVVEATKKYIIKNEEIVPEIGEIISIDINELKDTNLISEIDNCTGYINVIKDQDGIISYVPVLDCDEKYQTLDSYVEDKLVVYFDGQDQPINGECINRVTNGLNGAIVGTTYDNNKKAYIFDGNDSINLENPISEQTPTTQDWAVEAVIRVDSDYKSIDKSNETDYLIGDWNRGLSVSFYSTLKPLLYLNSGIYDYYDYASYDLSDSKIHHIIYNFKYDGDLIEIFIDGVDYSYNGARRDIRIPSGISSIVQIGKILEGEIYDFRIYNEHLTLDEVEHNYKIEKERFGL